jgi:hypothetical protein
MGLLFATGLFVPVLATAQGAGKPPMPVIPPPQALLQRPPGLPEHTSTLAPAKTYEQWMKEFYRVYPIPKKNAIVVGPGRVRPAPFLQVVLQVVREDENYYYVRNLPPEDPQSIANPAWRRAEGAEIFTGMKRDYFKDKYLIVDNPNVPPPFTDRVRFVSRGVGLPVGGRWQMTFDVADMNGDGLPDLVFGPVRTGDPTPHIFLQREDHSWGEWHNGKWPTEGLKLDYGSVKVADFDGDGNNDIAIACHFSRTYVLYGDGKGNFTRFVTIPQANPDITSRAIAVADFNGDGRPDIATLDEVNVNMATSQEVKGGLVNIALNLPSGWQAADPKGFPEGIMGDWLTAAPLGGDRTPDLLLTTRAQGVMDLVFRNLGQGTEWQSTARLQMPVNAYVFANAVAPMDGFKIPDLVQCFEQFNPWKVEPPTQACAIFHFHDAAGNPTLTPTPQVLFQEKADYENYQAVAVGDIDGDGRNDIVVATLTGRVRVFFQGADGAFYEQRNTGMDRPGTVFFDVRIADLYHDGKGEVILAGSPAGVGGGGIWVFQPEPPAGAGTQPMPKTP